MIGNQLHNRYSTSPACTIINQSCGAVIDWTLQVCPKREINLSCKNSILTFLLCVLTLFMWGVLLGQFHCPHLATLDNFIFAQKRGPEEARQVPERGPQGQLALRVASVCTTPQRPLRAAYGPYPLPLCDVYRYTRRCAPIVLAQ